MMRSWSDLWIWPWYSQTSLSLVHSILHVIVKTLGWQKDYRYSALAGECWLLIGFHLKGEKRMTYVVLSLWISFTLVFIWGHTDILSHLKRNNPTPGNGVSITLLPHLPCYRTACMDSMMLDGWMGNHRSSNNHAMIDWELCIISNIVIHFT